MIMVKKIKGHYSLFKYSIATIENIIDLSMLIMFCFTVEKTLTVQMWLVVSTFSVSEIPH